MTKPIIPKEPLVPDLTDQQIEKLTDIVFLPAVAPEPCDAIFVFGGTHPGHWQQAIHAYHRGYSTQVIVTGGVSPTGIKHPDWPDATMCESEGITAKLVEGGVPRNAIVFENWSRNTRENVLYAQEVVDFSQMRGLLFVGKSIGAGREYRTLAQNVPFPLRYIPFGFDAEYASQIISRHTWMQSAVGRGRVFGEYLRIVYYGRLGHVLPLEQEIDGLQGYVELNLGH